MQAQAHWLPATSSLKISPSITALRTRCRTASFRLTLGVDNTPAYRGVAYIVFDDLQLEKYGNRTPNLEFEVVTIADVPIWVKYDKGFELPISGIDTLTYDGERFVGPEKSIPDSYRAAILYHPDLPADFSRWYGMGIRACAWRP